MDLTTSSRMKERKKVPWGEKMNLKGERGEGKGGGGTEVRV